MNFPPENTPSDYAIETIGLCKTYPAAGTGPGKVALDNVSLNIPRGSFFALLGPNGAGKSTFINILAGLTLRTSGTARIWGHDIDTDMRAARRAIGIVPQELNLDPYFTPFEMLELQAGLYGVPVRQRRTNEILEAVGLTEQAGAYARSLSGGMRRRLLVAKAMVHSPPILVLDEPTAGVDVELRRQLWDHVRALNAKGTTILLTTHYLEEAEQLCDQIAIISRGRLIANEPTSNLLGRLDAREIVITVDRDVTDIPPALGNLHIEIKDGRRIICRYPPSQISGGEIIAAVQDTGAVIIDVATRESDLEDIFLQLTREAEDR